MLSVRRATIELCMYAEERKKRNSRTRRQPSATLASSVLSKPPKCIHNSIVSRCMFTVSFITLRLLKQFLDQFSEELKTTRTWLNLLVAELFVLHGVFGRTLWTRHLLKVGVEKKANKHPLSCSYSIAGLRVSISFDELRFY